METGARSGTYSQSLERGLAILSSFRSGSPLLGVSDLAREVGLSRSTTHRYIATLAALGYLQQDPATRKYRLGPRVLDLGFSAINSMDLRELAAPHLQALSDETGRTVNMAVLDGADIVYIERCRTSQRGQRDIDLNLHIGSRLPAYCTSMGKVLLAGLEPERQREVLEQVQFTQRGPNTLTELEDLLDELERVRSRRPRRQQRGARVWPALDRRARPLADGRGRRRDQSRGPPHHGLARLARRRSRPARAEDGRGNLREPRLPRGTGLSTVPAPSLWRGKALQVVELVLPVLSIAAALGFWELISRTGHDLAARPAVDERELRGALAPRADRGVLARVPRHRARLGARARHRRGARRPARDRARLERLRRARRSACRSSSCARSPRRR